jgi:ADP-ribosylglycohydrolase
MNNTYIDCLYVYALADTISYGIEKIIVNESKNKILDLSTVSECVNNFIHLGGVNSISLNEWVVSATTLYAQSIGIGMLSYKKKVDEKFILCIKNNLASTHNRIVKDEKNNIWRRVKSNTESYIEKFTDKSDARILPYDTKSNNNSCVARNICIGMALYQIEDLDNLIECAIQTSRLTNNSVIGYLAGFSVAFFVSLAIRKVGINEWIKLLIDILESEKIKKYINFKSNQQIGDYLKYIKYWNKYLTTRFVDGKRAESRATRHPLIRFKYYYDMFVADDSDNNIVGVGGFCALIMAYDCLLYSDGVWEKLIFYAMLHPGDSVVGGICGGLYGLVYGRGDVPNYMFEHIEEKKSLKDLGQKLYDKFHK